MQIKVSKLSLAVLNSTVTMPMTSAEDIMTYHGLSHVGIDIDDDYSVGLYNDWRGKYWTLEHRTGILFYSDSISDVKAWIKLGREDAKEQAQ